MGALWGKQVLEGTVAVLAQQLPALHRLIDALALLDMLCSLAVVVRRSLLWSAPPMHTPANGHSRGPWHLL